MPYSQRPEIDTLPHPEHPVYSAGNFGEVAPERLSVVSWSLVGDVVERASRRLVDRLWPGATWHTGPHYVFVGYFNCRPYHNLSSYCYMAEHIPGLAARDVTASYFEDARTPALPARMGVGRLARVWSLGRLVREVASFRPTLQELDGEVTVLECELRRLHSTSLRLGPGQLFSQARRTIERCWDVHYAITMGLVPLQSLQRAVGRRAVTHWDELEPWLNTPAELVWSTLHDCPGSLLDRGRFLGRSFYEIADDREPWKAYARAAPGPGSVQSVSSDADIAARAWSMEPWARMAGLPQLARLIGDTMAARETSKSLAMRCLHILRGLVSRIAEAGGIDDEDWPYLMAAELGDDAHDVGELRELAAERRRACEEALFLTMPEVLDTSADGEHVGGTAGQPRAARGVSPGIVAGRVVTRESVESAGEGPKVLVCEAADADIQPLLGLVDGVITARGSALSHVAILVREHGIPAVVGYTDIARLEPGILVSIDGSSGAVQILSQHEMPAVADAAQPEGGEGAWPRAPR